MQEACKKRTKHTTTEDEGAMLDGVGRAFSLAARVWEVPVDSRSLDEACVVLHKLKIQVQMSKNPKAIQAKLRMHLIMKPKAYLLFEAEKQSKLMKLGIT